MGREQGEWVESGGQAEGQEGGMQEGRDGGWGGAREKSEPGGRRLQGWHLGTEAQGKASSFLNKEHPSLNLKNKDEGSASWEEGLGRASEAWPWHALTSFLGSGLQPQQRHHGSALPHCTPQHTAAQQEAWYQPAARELSQQESSLCHRMQPSSSAIHK